MQTIAEPDLDQIFQQGTQLQTESFHVIRLNLLDGCLRTDPDLSGKL